MSDVSRTTGTQPPPTQQQERSASQEQPAQESQRRFTQKLKQERDEKASAKKSSQKEEKSQHLSNVMRQAAQKAQEKGQGQGKQETLDGGLGKYSGKDSSGRLLDEKRRGDSSGDSSKADAILQGLQPHSASTTSSAGVQETASSAPTSTDRLLEEFQTVADRVMHSSQSLQQGGNVRLQLRGDVLPGTSITFSMVAGALHVTFSGSNKKSLAKVREHEARMVSHVRKNSGVDIVVATQDESAGESADEAAENSAPDRQEGSL